MWSHSTLVAGSYVLWYPYVIFPGTVPRQLVNAPYLYHLTQHVCYSTGHVMVDRRDEVWCSTGVLFPASPAGSSVRCPAASGLTP
jgi:hypothetical protein